MVFAVITALYFLVFLRILKLVFSGMGIHILVDILFIASAVAAFMLSVVLADITEKKLRAHYKRDDV